MQPVDFTTLTAACSELRTYWLPSRTEQVFQRDRYTISIALRTLKQRGWLEISWHPQAARICIGNPPPRVPDTFTFSQQLIHQLGGLALVGIEAIAPWERVIDFQFARRPQESALYHVYVEIMGKYSNVILTDANNLIITAAHQVSQQQSSVRPIQTGQTYETPPKLTGPVPSVSESVQRWQERVSLVPGAIKRQLLKSYSGLSASLVESMVRSANIPPETTTDSLTPEDWQRLFQQWQVWLEALQVEKFYPAWMDDGYTVMGWGGVTPAKDTQELLNRYYTDQLNEQVFAQLRHQLNQKLNNILAKLRLKANTFAERLQQSDRADEYRHKADLLMANLHNWEAGMKEITLPDFETNLPVAIALQPDKNAVQNAQSLYKQHQKLKRARAAVEPLLAEVNTEIEYLEQVEAAIAQIEKYQTPEDLQALEEIRDELIGQRYLEDPEYRNRTTNEDSSSNFHRYRTPSGFEVLIGRNNRQNDQLTFRVAGDYDLWFHAQEIPGSHVLLRLEPGAVPEEADLQFTANLTSYYSRARQSDQVPVVYTQPKYVYKPKGAKPGIAIYKQERILWGQPQSIVKGQTL
ncbi:MULTISPECIES: Rqc2 family fibronectin-binding protein [unclassified Tolypothrix]|uniref:Rqc2 family fibronectin-binding protein n=1 Tax=unclassified Tolypothrix TaxID=2649714 RepID=UPI0005EAC257|nr:MULTISPECIES: NFACT family protein [unclassified Tolypothrix]BAY91867.1 fibronectin-binding A domain-containing protein [Microchaete diplosiphon NIES-3275]EKF04968.1 putative fibronectin-binding protein [Tolypothrix sp. PCC 7601]MBE9081277.1 NFACT family protein [Tolypothrix sp. LEGE 11397]UYD25875.1 NFACT family protein [Tolypothrix sp. PCC 7712]UYD31886.1 NFACT family protein [Tolypothrix sp. PCC 7601]